MIELRITELLTKETIAMDLSASDKNGVIDELVNQLDSAGKLSDIAQFKEAIHNRESQSTTGIGEGIAIPHAKVAAVKSPAIAFGKSKEGVDYQSLDGQPAHLFFMIAAPEGGAQTHLDALAKLSGILMDDKVRENLLQANSKEEILRIIDDADDAIAMLVYERGHHVLLDNTTHSIWSLISIFRSPHAPERGIHQVFVSSKVEF